MKQVYFFTLSLLLLGYIQAQAQHTLSFTVNPVNQIVINAGEDTTIIQGGQFRLGGNPTVSGGSGTFIYSWIPTTGLDAADVAQPMASPSQTTTYTLTVEDAQGCIRTDQVTVIVQTPAATKDAAAELGLSVFPNPSRGTFQVVTEQAIGEGSLLLEIFTPLGESVYKQVIQSQGDKLQQNIALKPEAKGMLLLRISNSKFYAIRKIIVQ